MRHWGRLPSIAGPILQGRTLEEIQRRRMCSSATKKRSWRLESRETLRRIPELEEREVEETTLADTPPPWTRGASAKVLRADAAKEDAVTV